VALSLVICILATTATGAQATAGVEGVWSFNGGLIAVQEGPAGSFEGTVVSPTKFSLCIHPQGEEIWTQMVRQPDGSYWGYHNWFFETPECVRNPALGQSAWRVLQNAEGRLLRACFSEPGSNLQPTIATDGSVTDATYGCADSALVSPVPHLPPGSVSRYVLIPQTASCLMRRTLRVVLRDPKNDPIRRALVLATGGGAKVRAKLRDTGRGILATLHLARLPEAFTVKVRLTTVLGQHLKSRHTYHRCRSGASK
jgi:hypothetical protein